MKVWKYLLKKEFKQFLRDPGMPRMVLCFPFLIILVFPFAANMEVRNLSLVIVDSDQSDQSALLTEKCASSGYFKIREVTESPSDAQAVMDRGGADAILTISSGFARYLGSDRGTDDPLPVGIFAVLGLASVAGSPDPAFSFYNYYNLVGVYLLMYFFIGQNVRTAQDFKDLLGALALSALCVVLYGWHFLWISI